MKKNQEDIDKVPSSLGNRKTRAILALQQYGAREKAAEAAGVNVVTLWRWLKQPPFQGGAPQSSTGSLFAKHRALTAGRTCGREHAPARHDRIRYAGQQ
jgi:hypothetical protein